MQTFPLHRFCKIKYNQYFQLSTKLDTQVSSLESF
jgi:hypothetical protein